MEDVIENFNERVEEIDEYLKLLQLISQPDTKIHRDGKRAREISQTAIKTMKASCFLMLYNLVESSVKSSMETLYEQMNNENNMLSGFDEYVKLLWIEQKFRDMDPFSSNQTSYRNLIKNMVDDVMNETPILLDANKLPISGNLDAKKIRELFSRHNISVNTHYRALHGAELRTIKDKRNSLSHGNETFSDCGQQYSVQMIIDIKKQTVVYLRSTLRNVKKYIEDSQYAA